MVSRGEEERDANSESRRESRRVPRVTFFLEIGALVAKRGHLPQASTMATLSYATELMFPAATQTFIQFLRQNIIPPGDAGYTVH